MELQVKFDPYSAADRDRVRHILDTFPSTRAKPPKENSATEAVLGILERHGDEARHSVIRREMNAMGHRGWLTAKRHLLKAGKIEKRGRGLYGVVKSHKRNQGD